MSNNKDPHIAGKYAIIAALIGAAALFGNTYYKHHLDTIKEERSSKVNSATPSKENLDDENKDQQRVPAKERKEEININADTFTDERDGKTYKWVRLKDGKKWMAENLSYKNEDGTSWHFNSWCLDEKPENCKQYGRLYTWSAAIDACPSGWHLPNDEEWWKMISNYTSKVQKKGDSFIRFDNDVYETLVKGGSSGFRAYLYGYRSSGNMFENIEQYGGYWTSSKRRGYNSWTYFFSGSSDDIMKGTVERIEKHMYTGLYIRCIED